MANFGIQFEQKMVTKLTDAGWVAIRSAASKTIDVVAAKKGHKPMFLELKATRAKTLRSYGNEIADARRMQLKVGNSVRVGFVMKLNYGKEVWLWLDTLKIDTQRTTFKDKEATERWRQRKVKKLKALKLA